VLETPPKANDIKRPSHLGQAACKLNNFIKNHMYYILKLPKQDGRYLGEMIVLKRKLLLMEGR
jgi:hypothetical protein